MLNNQIGMYRLDTGSGQQESYSTPFPDLPACNGNNAPCSPTIFEAPALDAGNNLFSFSPVWDKLSSDEQGRLLDKARTMLDPDGVIRVPSTALIAIGTKPQFT